MQQEDRSSEEERFWYAKSRINKDLEKGERRDYHDCAPVVSFRSLPRYYGPVSELSSEKLTTPVSGSRRISPNTAHALRGSQESVRGPVSRSRFEVSWTQSESDGAWASCTSDVERRMPGNSEAHPAAERLGGSHRPFAGFLASRRFVLKLTRNLNNGD